MFKQLHTRAIVPIVVLLMLSASAVGAVSANLFAPARPVIDISVVDARGRLVGSVQDPVDLASGGTIVVVRVGATPVILSASTTWLGPAGNTAPTNLAFESTDCTGQAFGDDITGPPSSLFPLVGLNGTRLFLRSGSAQNITARSFIGFSDTPGPCQAVEPIEQTLVPMQVLADLSADFQPPFRLRIGDHD